MRIRAERIANGWQLRRVDENGFTWMRREYRTPQGLWRAIRRLQAKGDYLSPQDEAHLPPQRGEADEDV